MGSFYSDKVVMMGLIHAVLSGVLYYFQDFLIQVFLPSSNIYDYPVHINYLVGLTSGLVYVISAIMGYRLVYRVSDREYLLKHIRVLLVHLLLVIGFRFLISVAVTLIQMNINVVPGSFFELFLLGLTSLWNPYLVIESNLRGYFLLAYLALLIRSLVMVYAGVLGLHLWSQARKTISSPLPTWSRFGVFILLFVISIPVSSNIQSVIFSLFLARLLSIDYYVTVANLLYTVFFMFTIWLVTQILDDRTRSSLQLNTRVQYLLAAAMFILLSLTNFLGVTVIESSNPSPQLLTLVGLNVLFAIFQWVSLILVITTLQHGISQTSVSVDQELLYQAPIVKS